MMSRFRFESRRGMAVLLVLGVLAITLAVCYATLRGQGTTSQLARNNSRSLQAREAARSGLAAALRKMSESNWGGVGVGLNSNVTPDSWYEVTFSTGDSTLSVADPKYGEYPYRVTIDSVGYASDPSDPSIRAIHKSRCVVQLVRKALLAEPLVWTTLTGSTIYQWANRNAYVQEPVRVSGRTTVLGRIVVSAEYPLTVDSRDRYLSDLNAMRIAGRGDWRPLTGPLYWAAARQDATGISLVTTKLGLTPTNCLDSTLPPLLHPGVVASYQLYPGGKTYTPPLLQFVYGSSIANVTLAADPATNPLGIFRSNGSLEIKDNVKLTGTLIGETSSSNVQVNGTNIVLQAAALPKLYGSNTNYQLPLALIRDDIRVDGESTTQWTGFTMVWDEFELKKDETATTFTMLGNLATAGLSLKGRDTWTMTATAWGNDYNDYMGTGSILAALLNALFNTIRNALGIPAGEPVYFPEYMQYQRGFQYKPTLTFQPNLSGVQPHWQDWSKPLYQKGPTDEGLSWDVIRWEDSL